ncbi:NAD(P)-binding domain-containing protein [Nannocystis pusilla]|uniref:NAD(P)-binding domain-containing protein n=1 Tax=Nannocystis pusilla TaxID=889268 RepID=A0A9X3F0R0_9BACT|nr:NAD(P)-binding domain-containing protein [Nannocystis pusilla]MCY1013651.1 NAD(P)-binding domain-containing protein [Nannocystis pusilla]
MTHKVTVSIVGLGQMGAALARAYIDAGHPVTVWNRTPGKAEPFHGQANVAATPEQACGASDLTIVSLSDYEASDQVLRTPLVAAAAKGRTLVQLTSGTPGDARSGAAWASSLGIDYLDGCILAYPSYIGGEQTAVFYSGPRDLYERHQSTLRVIGGATSHVGEPIGAAAALDCALLSSYYGATLAVLQGAAICASESFPLDAYFEKFQAIMPLISITADMCKKMLSTGNSRGPIARWTFIRTPFATSCASAGRTASTGGCRSWPWPTSNGRCSSATAPMRSPPCSTRSTARPGADLRLRRLVRRT